MLVGDRQTIDFDFYYRNYEFVNQMMDLWDAFCNDNVEEALKDMSFNPNVDELIKALEVGLGRTISDKVDYSNETVETYTTDKNNHMVVCFSGGKDSLAATLKYKELGYDVKLVKVDGINKGFPLEVVAAKNLAEKLDLDLHIEKISLKGKKYHIEHPLKNQIICTLTLAYCLEHNITPNIAFGDFTTDTYTKSHYGIDWCDCYELWMGYEKFIQTWVPDFKIHIAFEAIDDSYEIMSKNVDYIRDYQSCLMTLKYRGKLHKTNEDKYKVVDMLSGCGSCWKCAMEYIYYADKGVLQYNRAYYEHCLKVLKDKFPSAKSELPIPDCNRDTYEGYFVKMKYCKDSIYFKDTQEY